MSATAPEGRSRIEVGDLVELIAYHPMRGPWGGPTSRYFAPGLQGKVIRIDPHEERGELLHVRFEQGPPAPLHPDEVKRITDEDLRSPRHFDPTLEQRLDFLRSLHAERREWSFLDDYTGEEAAALVGAEDFSELTNGPDGTAQELIDQLLTSPTSS